MPEPPLAVVDIGSNSGRMIVVRLSTAGCLEIISDARTPLRLVGEIDSEGRLGSAAVERIVAAVRDFQSIAVAARAVRTVGVATAAVREAVNGARVVERVRRDTGLEITVIDGEEEARLAFLGAVHGLPVEDGLLVDVGGGSLEISQFRERRLSRSWTLPLGALRLTGRFLVADPPRASEISQLCQHTATTLADDKVPPLTGEQRMVGSGGTIRNIAKMHHATLTYPIPRLHGYVLGRREVRDIASRVCSRRLSRRAALAGLSSDRADSITGGALAVQVVMEMLGASDLVVSGQGLREGVALARLGGRLPSSSAVREASVSALVSRFTTCDSARAQRRRRMVAALIDMLDPETLPELREALDHAATLLDVGRSVDYYHRWEHAATIVLAADLRGFSHRTIAMLASLIERAGRDRASLPGGSVLLSADDRRAIGRAAVVLALADELERRLPPRRLPTLQHRRRKRALVLSVPMTHQWQPAGVADRFRRVFGEALVIEPAGSMTS
ncbi:MAG: Ppx/GppA family phosphatase [Chloroflexi bacterium]|nr:MAG: Ppx/GppA family phosphatase [Chloroflexota bacterium]